MRRTSSRTEFPAMRLTKAIRLFLRSYFEQSDRSSKTFKAYDCDLRQFAEFLERDPLLSSIAPQDCEMWVEHLKQQGYSAASRKRKVATLRCFFGECIRRNRLSWSPLQQLRFRFPTGKDIPKTLTLSDARSLLEEVRRSVGRVATEQIQRLDSDFLKIRNRAVVELLVSTGIRVGELTALLVHDVNPDNRTVLIQGKGGRERIAFLTDDACLRALQVYLAIRNQVPCDSASLFLNSQGVRLSEQGVAYILQILAKKVHLNRRLTPHMLRHTAATLLLQSGADIRIVQEFLGHASITTTQRYAHVTRAHLRATLDKLHHSRLLNA